MRTCRMRVLEARLALKAMKMAESNQHKDFIKTEYGCKEVDENGKTIMEVHIRGDKARAV